MINMTEVRAVEVIHHHNTTIVEIIHHPHHLHHQCTITATVETIKDMIVEVKVLHHHFHHLAHVLIEEIIILHHPQVIMMDHQMVVKVQ